MGEVRGSIPRDSILFAFFLRSKHLIIIGFNRKRIYHSLLHLIIVMILCLWGRMKIHVFCLVYLYPPVNTEYRVPTELLTASRLAFFAIYKSYLP